MESSWLGSVWEMAVKKQMARRELGRLAGKRGMTDGVFLEDLQSLGMILLASMPKPAKKDNSRSNYATVVTGYWPYDGNGNDKPLRALGRIPGGGATLPGSGARQRVFEDAVVLLKSGNLSALARVKSFWTSKDPQD